MRPTATWACLLVLTPLLATAAPVTVAIGDRDRQPVASAVVTVEPADAATPAGPVRRQTRTIDQRNETFIPYVELFRPGDEVVFRNSDRVRHHVYSFSATRKFDFVLRPGESSQPLTLDRAGIVAIGCNIHDHMLAYLVVGTAWRTALSGADGRAALGDLPPGRYRLEVWHPQLRPGQSPPAQPFTVEPQDDGKTLNVDLNLLPDPRDRPHEEY